MEPRLATLTRRGATERLPLSADGRDVLLSSADASQIYRFSLEARGAKPEPLLGDTVDGVRRAVLEREASPGGLTRPWAPVWGEAPFFGPSGRVVYYFSNRMEPPGSPIMELWSKNLTTGQDVLLDRGQGLAGFGIDAMGRIVVADLEGNLIAVSGKTPKVLATDTLPLAMGPGGLRLLAEDTRSGSVFLLDLVSDRKTPVELGRDRFAGGAAFSPEGAYLALIVLTPSRQEDVRLFRMTSGGPVLVGDIAAPQGQRIVLEAPPSWLDGDRLVLVLADLHARLSTWACEVGRPSGI